MVISIKGTNEHSRELLATKNEFYGIFLRDYQNPD